MRRFNAQVLCLLVVICLLLYAGSENIGGSGQAKRVEVGKTSPDLVF